MEPAAASSPRTRVLATVPQFIVGDLQRAIDFYCSKLGFGEPSLWGEPPCFAIIERDGLEIFLSAVQGEQTPRPNGPSGAWDLYLRVVDVDAEAEQLRRAGVEIVRGPTDAPYLMREIEVLDPDGYRLCFAQDITPDPRALELAAELSD